MIFRILFELSGRRFLEPTGGAMERRDEIEWTRVAGRVCRQRYEGKRFRSIERYMGVCDQKLACYIKSNMLTVRNNREGRTFQPLLFRPIV